MILQTGKATNPYTKLSRASVRTALLLLSIGIFCFFISVPACPAEFEQVLTESIIVNQPYNLDLQLKSRSVSHENRTGSPGEGGRAISRLGEGRKGSPSVTIKPGKAAQLCDIEGPGTVRRIWMTTYKRPLVLRGVVIRAYWEDQTHPSIEAPLGDFFGFAHGKVEPYQSAVHSLGKRAGMTMWLPMPFVKRCRITLSNESKDKIVVFYKIDYTLGDRHTDEVGRLHVLFRRENPTTLKKDFVILPKRKGKGRYMGAVLGIRTLSEDWWGEGEFKAYLDDDDEYPTIVGTGTEDYAGLSWGILQTSYRYHGACLVDEPFHTLYRWHIPDPIFWRTSFRAAIQQIGHKKGGLYERRDDVSTATFWYEPVPGAPLPPIPTYKERTENLWEKSKKK